VEKEDDMVFEGIIGALAVSGMFPVYLAFLLVFAIIFGILSNTKILGGNPRIDALVAFIIGLYLCAFSPLAVPISQWFVAIFSATSVILVSLLVFIIVVAMLLSPFWSEVKKGGGHVFALLAVVGIVIGGLIVFGGSFGFGGTLPQISTEDIVFILFVVITLILIYFIIGGKPVKEALLPIKTHEI